MKIISPFVHGILDYSVGALLAAAPWLLGFARGGAETFVPVLLGAGALVYSLLTRYPLGALKVIPFTAHLAIDAMSGLLLLASPWLFGFADHVSTPHVVFGLLELGVVAMTRTSGAMSYARA